MMKTYEKYKDSGVEWIGEVPEHWEKHRFKDFLQLNTNPSFNENKIGLENIEGKTGRFIETSSEFEGNGIEFIENDIVYGKLRPYLKKVWLAEFAGNAVGDFFIFRNKKNSDAHFLKYLFLSDGFTKEADGSTFGAKMPRVSSDFIRSMTYYLPLLSEQQCIASYLDKKCADIDKVIATQQRRIELLQELKQSTITNAVTHGLNPNVEMKDSSVEWIGEVPEHWNTLRLRFVCKLRNGYTPSKANPDFWSEGTIPWYRMEDIRESGRRLNEAKQYITESAIKGGGLFEAGSFIMATTATIGEHAVLIVDSLANQRFTNLKIRKSLSHSDFNAFFFQYLFVVDDYCKTTTKTATFPAVNMEDLKNFIVCIPPLDEQKIILTYLDKKCAELDVSISKAQREIDLLQEYKQALITEVVTGKRKVC
jgi:type I restriction enzyme S subunit